MNALSPIDTKPLVALSADEARGPLLILFSAYPEPWADKTAEKAESLRDANVRAYLLGLAKLPSWAIDQAVRNFIQGKVDRPARRRGILPTVEELAAETRTHLEQEALKQRAAKAKHDEAKEVDRFSDTHKLRMKFKLAVCLKGMHLRQADRVAQAQREGFDSFLALAQEWGMPIPENVWALRGTA